MSDYGSTHRDPYLNKMREARDSVAVLKLRIISFRTDHSAATIFLVEGTDDKIVYCQWIQRVKDDFEYEFFVAGGKRELKKLKTSLSYDMYGLQDGIYYFVDRDFDDLSGFSDTLNLFMTDRYSVENYLVDESVLKRILGVEFPFGGNPILRGRINALFARCYEAFLTATKEVNRRIFLARKLGIQIDGKIANRLSVFALVDLHNVTSSRSPIEQCVPLLQSIDQHDLASLHEEFEALIPHLRYRGKFALLFFLRWLDLLSNECNRTSSEFFVGNNPDSAIRRSELTLGTLAARSPLPIGFANFLMSIKAS